MVVLIMEWRNEISSKAVSHQIPASNKASTLDKTVLQPCFWRNSSIRHIRGTTYFSTG